MTSSTAAPNAEHHPRRATPYYRKATDGSRQVFPYYDMNGLAAAGNIVSNVEDLARSPAPVQRRRRRRRADPRRRDAERNAAGPVRQPGLQRRARARLRRHPRRRRHLGDARRLDRRQPHPFPAGARREDGGDRGRQRRRRGSVFFSRKIYDIVAPAMAKATATPTARVADPAWQRYVGVYSDPWGWETR